MTYKVNDLVYFEDALQKGVGKVVAINGRWRLVYSTQITDGHGGNGFIEEQGNKNNWYFREEDLKPFTKKVGQKYRVICNVFNSFEIGDIATLTKLDGGVSFYETEDEAGFLYDLDHHKREVEFYEDVEDAKEQKEKEMFTKDDLKVGYLVKFRNGEFAHVVDTIDEGMCLDTKDRWNTLRNYNNDLTNRTAHMINIIEVYGYTRYGLNAHKFEIGNRELLWKREEVKEMTIEEIQKVLGHKIKVVE